MKQAAAKLSICLSLTIVSACGGGNDVDGQQGVISEQPSNGGSSQPVQSTGGFNGGLTGRIITTYKDEPVQLDLSSGLMTKLPVDTIQDWLARNGHDSDTNSYFGAGGISSAQYIQTVPECFRDEETLRDYDSCIATYDDNFVKLEQIRLTDIELTLPAHLSPSGQFVAFNEYHSFAGIRWSNLLLMDVAGKSIVDSFAIDVGESGPRYVQADPSPIAWAPDDALIYTVPSDDRVVVYITKPGSLELDNTITLPSSYQGEVVSLDVSPDGSKLLIGYNPSQGVFLGGVLLLDLESLQVFVPAIVPAEVDIVPLGDDIKGYIRTPRWSADGQWIMVRQGRGSFLDTSVSTTEHLYAVPANKSRTVLTMESPTEAVLINVEYPDRPGQLTNAWLGDDIYESDFDWVE